eukprot:1075465-Rhodomonas_salina.1
MLTACSVRGGRAGTELLSTGSSILYRPTPVLCGARYCNRLWYDGHAVLESAMRLHGVRY